MYKFKKFNNKNKMKMNKMFYCKNDNDIDYYD